MLWIIALLACDGGECPDVAVEVVGEAGACPDVVCEATECPDLSCDCPATTGSSGSRSVVEVYINRDVSDSECQILDDPGECCPDGFSHVGMKYHGGTPHVVCLEDE